MYNIQKELAMSERTKEEIAKHIAEVLETYVMPYVAQHGGEVRYKDFEAGTVLLEMSGACSGCAGSTATLKYGVQNILMQMVPEVDSVEGMDDPHSSIPPYMQDWLYEDFTDLDIDPSN